MNYADIQISGDDTGAFLNVQRRHRIIKKHIDLTDTFILDCGCGSGEYILEFLNYSPNVYGIEYDFKKVETYKSLGVHTENVIQGDIQDMQFKDETFDVVFLNEVLEHIPNQKKVLAEIRRVLKKDGVLVVRSPNRLYPFEVHGVKLKFKEQPVSNAIPFIPYIPIRIGELVFTYIARNYFPWELKSLLRITHFKIQKHSFISQTFEGIGGHNHPVYKKLRPTLRRIFFVLENIPVLQMFIGASQVIIAKRR